MLEPTSYQAIGWLVVGLASLCVAVNQIDDFFERRTPRAGFPPVTHLASPQHSLADRVENLDAAVSPSHGKMKDNREAKAKSASIRAAGLCKKIDEVRAEVSA